MEAGDEGASYDEEVVPIWYADGAYVRVRPDVCSLVFYQDIPNAKVKKGAVGALRTDEQRRVIMDIKIPSTDLMGIWAQFLIGIGILGRAGVKFPAFKIEPDKPLQNALAEYEKQNPTEDLHQKLRQKGIWVGGPEWANWFGKRQAWSFTLTLTGSEADAEHDPLQ